MTWDEFVPLAMAMRSAYTSNNFMADPESMKLWYRLLQDIPFELAGTAILRHISTSKFPPTIAEIRAACVDAVSDGGTSWLEGWNTVNRVMHRYGYDRPREAIAAISKVDERAGRVAELLGWENLCISENPTADRANFRQCYEAYAAREKETAQIPPGVTAMLQAITNGMADGQRMIGSAKGE